MEIKRKVFDYIVIGAGSGGLLVGVGLQKLGKNVAVVSKNIGGDCTHFGCVPSKTLLHLSKKHKEYCNKEEKAILRKTALSEVQKMIESFSTEEINLLAKDTYFEGSANFIDNKCIQVNQADKNELLEFRKACVIASGSSPIKTQIPGIPYEKIISNEDFFTLKELPKSITIIGGGPIGAELATACANFGVETYLLAREYLSREPAEISKRSLASLKTLGVQYFPARADHMSGNKLILEDNTSIPQTDYYLTAVGRKPNTQLNLEKANVEYDDNGIIVNKNLVTSNRNIFAVGDCTQNPQFTHLAANHGKFVLKKIAIPFVKRKERALPRVTFTNPPIASVGELEESNNIKAFILDLANTDRGRTNYNNSDYGIVMVDLNNGRVKGVSIISECSEDLINVFTLIIDEKISLLKLADFITPYPTYGNILHTLCVEYLSYLSKNWKQRPIRSFIQLLAYIFN